MVGSLKMKKLFDTPIKSIRKYCLNICSYTPKEVRKCILIDCPLYVYRMGTRPTEQTVKSVKNYHSKNHKPTK